MIKITKSRLFQHTAFVFQLAVFLTILIAFSNSSAGISVNAQYGGTVSSVNNLRNRPGRNVNGIELDDPYDCGGLIIGGSVQGGTKPYSVTLTLISSNRTLNRTAIFGSDRENWTSEVSYDTTNPSYIPTDTYTITSFVRDANGSTAVYTYSAFIRPPKDCNSNNSNQNTNQNNSSTISKSSVNSSSSSSSSVVITTQSNNNTNTPLSQTYEVIKVVQTQLLRTGGFAQNNPLLFSSSVLILAFGTSLLIKKPKRIKR